MVGGACVTEELFPGYRLSSCSYICHLLQEQVIRDLDLPRHGFKVFPLEPARFHPFPDGRHLVVWEDVGRTAAEIERYSKRDAAAYPRWIALWERAAALLHPYFLAPAPTYAELAARVQGTPDEEIFETLLTRPMWDLVHEYFESDLMRAHAMNAQDLGDPRAPGSALIYAYIRVNLRSAPDTVGIVKGGMGGITQAMARAAGEAGSHDPHRRRGGPGRRAERPRRRRRPRRREPRRGGRRRLERRPEADVPPAGPAGRPARGVPRADRGALDPGGVLQVPRGAPRAARLLRPTSGPGSIPGTWRR